ncbi:sporulation protein [Clostridiaceae bacterium]|nr:sporulation protein [Clostridiaceae bacterium]
MVKAGAHPCLAMDVRNGGSGESAWEGTGGGEAGQEEREAGQTELESLIGELDLTPVEHFLREQTQTESVTFKELLGTLLKGDFSGVFHQCVNLMRDSLLAEIEKGGSLLGQVMALGLVGALFANFCGVFSNSQIAETGFYVTYLLMFTFLAASFLEGVSVAGGLLSGIFEFMRALVPTYFAAVSFAGGSVSAAAGYGWMLFSIGLAEWVFIKLIMPMIRVYILFILAGCLLKEDLFSRMTELLETVIRWGLKSAAGVILGFQMLQNMVLPYADSLKNASIQRIVSAVPGLGGGAGAVSQMLLGAGVLLKNTMGAAAVLVLVMLSLAPLLKLLALCFFYRAAAAILQPVCDKRMAACINGVGDGCWLLLSVSGTALLLFGLSLAIICMSANAVYFAG